MKRALWKRVKEFLYCLLAVLCLAAAGSDGSYFPWVNIIGAAILTIMAMVHLRGHKRRDILSRLDQRMALENMVNLNARLHGLNERMKSQGATTIRY